MYNNHPNKPIFEYMVQMLQSYTKTITLHKRMAYVNIDDNKQAYALIFT